MDKIKQAAVARSNLNIFAAVQALMENGLISGGENKYQDQIIRICERARVEQLKKYDAAVLAVKNADK